MTLEDFLTSTYRLSYVTRYSNRARIRDESVAEHSFFVALIVIRLHEDYNFDLEKALIAALSHDVAESDLSDVTHDIKTKYVQLSNALQEAEFEEIAKYPTVIKSGFTDFEVRDSPESLIANLADILQVRQYINSEMNMGNSTFADINYTCRKRISVLMEGLKQYEREDRRNS